MSFEQDLGDSADFRPTAERRLREFDVVQASDVAAVDTDEMGVPTRFVIRVAELEPPDVVAKLGPRDESRVDQVGEVAKDGRLVEAEGDQFFGDFGVGDGRFGVLQAADDREPGRRGPQADIGEQFADLRDGGNVVLTGHERCDPTSRRCRKFNHDR
jgi:hypothetical protein